MLRISDSYINQNTISQFNNNQLELNKVKNQLGTQKKIQQPHESPSEAHLIHLYQNKSSHINRYLENIQEGKGYLNFVELQLNEILTYLKEAREKALSGSNGILSATDRKNLAIEIDQYLKQVLEVANSQYKGQKVFAGYQVNKNPFVTELSKGSYSNTNYITKVSYQGDKGKIYREIDQGNFININLSGAEIFWSSNYKIMSQIPSNDYIAFSSTNKEYQKIKINDVIIQINNGDNLNVIADKINQSNAAVNAYIDHTTPNRFLILETKYPHKMELKDLNESTILQDLGFLAKGNNSSPNSTQISPLAIVEEKNIFKDFIELRDSLLHNDFDKINQKIGDIDLSIDNITQKQAIIGTKQNRIFHLGERLIQGKLNLQNDYAKIQSPDVNQILEYKNAEMAYLVSLNIGAKISKLTLLNFI